MRKKTHDEFVRDFYSKHEPDEYTVLGQFVNSSTSIFIRHNKCGKEYYAKPYNLYMGKGCRECSVSNKRNHDEYVYLIKEKYGEEYEILSNYINSKSKILVKHNKCATEYETVADTLLRGHGCRKCTGTLKYTNEQVSNIITEKTCNEYKLVSSYKSNNKNIDVLHVACDTVFKTTFIKFVISGSRCPVCNNYYRRTNEYFKKKICLLVGDEYTVLSEFIRVSNKIRMRHNNCGNEYMVTPQGFLKGRRCPLCNESKGEVVIRRYLDKNNIDYKTEYKIKKCKDKQILPFDFAIFNSGKLMALIEYQGEQHYKNLEYFGWKEKFKDRQQKDKIKKDFCKLNNIPLIEVPYIVKDIEKYLKKQLQNMVF